MKKIKRWVSAMLLSIIIITSCPFNIFAANRYNIDYTDGAALGSNNVQIEPELIDGLSPLITSGSFNPEVQEKWQDGYAKFGDNCYPFKYFKVFKNSAIKNDSGYNYILSNEQYDMDIIFDRITLDSIALDDDEFVTVGVLPNRNSFIYGGWTIYSNDSCTTRINGLKLLNLSSTGGGKLFIQMNLKLHKKGQTDVYKANGVYFGITDIDAAQSFKILNAGNELTPENMYAKNAEDLQDLSQRLRNRYVASEKYIYSQYDIDDKTYIATPDNSNIFLELEEDTQENGVDVVFGFAMSAGSGITYYAKQYNVTYVSEEQGSITGITSEKVIAGENPSGSTATPNGYWVLDGWTANKDVTLKNGDVISAGDPITDEDIKNVVVDDDIEFTAHYEIEEFEITYTTDGHGTITGIEDESVYSHENPSGSEQEPNTGYTFTHWVADKDVTLTDDTTIPAGSPITNDQIQEVVVTENLTFTAINEANTYTVNYTSDANGTITGKTTETISYESHPTGTTETPATGYNFTHWVADKDVTLTDGTTIEAGEPIDEEELTDVVITDDITFTAINEINTYTITYTSDENGTITGETEEVVEHGNNPTGTTETPNDGYEFKEWVADVDINLTDGTTIIAGDPITSDQITLIIIDRDITLTAINQAKEEPPVTPEPEIPITPESDSPVSPETGSITKNTEGAELVIVPVSTLIALISGTLAIRLLPRFLRRKMWFGKK